MIEHVNGMRVVVSSECLERTNFPAREHVRTPSMSDAYHRRIAKKWLKRFGFVHEPCMFLNQLTNTIMMHPTLYDQMKREGLVKRLPGSPGRT